MGRIPELFVAECKSTAKVQHALELLHVMRGVSEIRSRKLSRKGPEPVAESEKEEEGNDDELAQLAALQEQLERVESIHNLLPKTASTVHISVNTVFGTGSTSLPS